MTGPYHTETGPLICSANPWTGFYTVRLSVINELNPIFQVHFKRQLRLCFDDRMARKRRRYTTCTNTINRDQSNNVGDPRAVIMVWKVWCSGNTN